MNKIENVTVLIIEDADFTSSKHGGDMHDLDKAVQAGADTADIVIHDGFVVKNRYGDILTSGVK